MLRPLKQDSDSTACYVCFQVKNFAYPEGGNKRKGPLLVVNYSRKKVDYQKKKVTKKKPVVIIVISIYNLSIQI